MKKLILLFLLAAQPAQAVSLQTLYELLFGPRTPISGGVLPPQPGETVVRGPGFQLPPDRPPAKFKILQR